MLAPPSDTFFTYAPRWDWLIVLYFFFGGLSAGCFVLAAIAHLGGRESDRPLVRLGYVASMVALLPCPPLLVLDLSRPERFWHMLLMNNRLVPIFKPWSPMSFGSWALAIFGALVTAAFLGVLGERRGGRLGRLAFLGRGLVGRLVAAVGAVFGLVIAGYTGVLLSVTNRAVWADTTMLGALFLLSAATTSAALLGWLGRGRVDEGSRSWLARIEGWFALAELAALALVVVTLGPVARVWFGGWGALLVGVVLFGLLAPILLHHRPALLGARALPVAAFLALAGGFVLRAVVILSGERA